MSILENLLEDSISCLEHNPPLKIDIDATIRDAIHVLHETGRGCVLISDGEELRGIFTERDVLMKILSENIDLDHSVKDYMSTELFSIHTDDKVADVIKSMRKNGFRHIPIYDKKERVMGILSVKHIVHYLVDHFPDAIYNLPPDPDKHATEREGA